MDQEKPVLVNDREPESTEICRDPYVLDTMQNRIPKSSYIQRPCRSVLNIPI